MSTTDLRMLVSLEPNARLPEYGSEWSAGLDVFANISQDITIGCGQRTLISTGIRTKWDNSNYYMRVAPRSGLSVKQGIDIGAGVIDYDYRGIIHVLVINNGQRDFIVTPNMKIAQLVPTYTTKLNIVQLDNLPPEQGRGENGFGSTGL